MNWSNEAPLETCKFKDMYDNFSENMICHNLEQMVKIPTRDKNILDLFLTNTPGQVCNTKTLPGLGSSDHDMVFHEISVKRGRIKQMPRKVKSYNKANWSEFKKDLVTYTKEFIQHRHKDPNTLWNLFKDEINRLSATHIPTRQSKKHADLPWITHNIVKQIRKRDKLYTKLKRSTSINTTCNEKFKKLKSSIQRQIRNAYWSYFESIIFS